MLLALSLAAVGSVAAVDWKSYPDAVKKGDVQISAGMGLLSKTPIYGGDALGPWMLNVDYALPLGGLPFTLGAFAGYSSVTSDSVTVGYDTNQTPYKYAYNFTGLLFAGRLAYHPNFGSKKWDYYASLSLGYYFYLASVNFTGDWGNDSAAKDSYTAAAKAIAPADLFYGINIGARYFFTSRIGVGVELGYNPLCVIVVGLTYKL